MYGVEEFAFKVISHNKKHSCRYEGRSYWVRGS